MKHVDYFLPTHLPSLPSLPRVPAHEEGREGDDGLDGETGAREEVLYDGRAGEGDAMCGRVPGEKESTRWRVRAHTNVAPPATTPSVAIWGTWGEGTVQGRRMV